jgi:hypothetical protein
MRRLCAALLLLLLLSCGCASAQEPAEILGRIRHNVAEQLTRSTNYACVETIERTYFRTAVACDGKTSRDMSRDTSRNTKPYLRDRLRLDVAVSKQSEIFSWHGEDDFSSASVADVVKSGPISSGGFVGYLMNIFLERNVQIAYVGESNENGAKRYNFRYDVPLASSSYHAETRKEAGRIPFHGSFSADADNFQLTHLVVTGDGFPAGSDLCLAETEVSYQIAKISGADSLIPSGFLLRIGSRGASLYTESAAKYSGCREFKGESTILFDGRNEPSKAPAIRPAATQTIPAGKILRVRLTTPIDDKTSFTGDPVEGVLVEPVAIDVPANAAVRGVITEFSTHYDPAVHYYLRIEFERLTAGGQVYSLRALHKPKGNEGDKLFFLFGDNLPENIKQELRRGAMIFDAKHVRLDRGFTGDWETIELKR